MTDIPAGYELASDVPEGYEAVVAPTVEQKIASYQFPTSALQTLAQMKNSPEVQKGGLVARAGLEGIAAPVTLGSDVLGAGVNALAGQQAVPSLSGMVSNALSDIGLPKPTTPLQRLSSDVISGAVGGRTISPGALSALVGGVSGGASGTARELGASPLAQLATGISAGALTGGIGNGLESVLSKPTTPVAGIVSNLESQGIDELSSFPKTRAMLQDEATKQQGKISDLFTQAQERGDKAFIDNNQLNGLANALKDKAATQIDSDAANVFNNAASKISNLANMQGEPTGLLDAEGKAITKPVFPSLNNLETIRRTASQISNTGGSTGYAGKQIAQTIDSFLNDAKITGDKDAVQTWKDAITARREYGQKFEQPKEIAAALEDSSPEAIEQKFIGSGGASLNKELSTTYKNTLNALPEDQREQAGFLLRQSIVNRMVKNAAQSSDSAEGISAQRLSNQIRNFRRDNQSMWNNFTPDEQDVLKNMESDLRDKTQGGVINSIGQHLFKFMGKATNSNLELPRTLKPKTILTTDELLDLTRQKPEGFGAAFKAGVSNPATLIGNEAEQYQK